MSANARLRPRSLAAGPSEATERLLRYAFGTLGMHRVELRVREFDTGAIRMYERCGFVREGVEREGVRIGGTWQNEVLMAVLEQDHARMAPGRTSA